jgi:hypothetical protein
MKSNVARRDKANNPVRISLWSCVQQIPDDCLTNGIFGFDYRLWRYRIPLPIDGNPILTLPDVVASAVTISVRAQHTIPLGDRIFSNHSRMAGGTSLNCPRSIAAAAVALTAQNMSVATSGCSGCLGNILLAFPFPAHRHLKPHAGHFHVHPAFLRERLS